MSNYKFEDNDITIAVKNFMRDKNLKSILN